MFYSLLLISCFVVAINAQHWRNCNQTARAECTHKVGLCSMEAGANTKMACQCLSNYIWCENEAKCLGHREYEADLVACQLISNCTCPQITLPSHSHHWTTRGLPTPAPAPSPPPTPFNTPKGCNSQYFYNCSTTFAECETDAGNDLEKTCECFGPYLHQCLKRSGCSTPHEVAELQNGCRLAGCSPRQCGENGPPKTCDSSRAAQCAQTLQACGRSNPNDACTCFVDFVKCIKPTNCLTPEQLKKQEEGCAKRCPNHGCPM